MTVMSSISPHAASQRAFAVATSALTAAAARRVARLGARRARRARHLGAVGQWSHSPCEPSTSTASPAASTSGVRSKTSGRRAPRSRGAAASPSERVIAEPAARRRRGRRRAQLVVGRDEPAASGRARPAFVGARWSIDSAVPAPRADRLAGRDRAAARPPRRDHVRRRARPRPWRARSARERAAPAGEHRRESPAVSDREPVARDHRARERRARGPEGRAVGAVTSAACARDVRPQRAPRRHRSGTRRRRTAQT